MYFFRMLQYGIKQAIDNHISHVSGIMVNHFQIAKDTQKARP